MNMKFSSVFVAGAVADEIALQARVDGITMAEVVRQAAQEYVDRRKSEFRMVEETPQILVNRRVVSIRFSVQLADEVESLAYGDDLTPAMEVREAIRIHLEDLKENQQFQQRLQAVLEWDQALAYRMCGVTP